MKASILAVLCGILLGGNLLATLPQDPPLPDATAYCAMNHKEENGKCQCTDVEVGGAACKRNDNNRPRICKFMCGHAKSCHCCES